MRGEVGGRQWAGRSSLGFGGPQAWGRWGSRSGLCCPSVPVLEGEGSEAPRALAACDFSGALGSKVTFCQSSCLQAGCWPLQQRFSERARPTPPRSLRWGPRRTGRLLRGLGLAWASLGWRCAALITAVTASWALRPPAASSSGWL